MVNPPVALSNAVSMNPTEGVLGSTMHINAGTPDGVVGSGRVDSTRQQWWVDSVDPLAERHVNGVEYTTWQCPSLYVSL